MKILKKILLILFSFNLSKFLFSGLSSEYVIFCFHRVVPDNIKNKNFKNDPYVVSESYFKYFIEYLKINYEVCRIEDINVNSNESVQKKRKCIITFDDGYIDNLLYAIPVLLKYNFPAIIYVCPGIIERKVVPYDELIRLIQLYKIPLNFINGNIANSNEREILINKVKNLYPEIIRDSFKSFMNKSDLINISNIDLITIGSHSYSHLNLKLEKENIIFFEIEQSKYILEKILSTEINHFAYPYGGMFETSELINLKIKEVGYKSSSTTLNHKNINLYNLSRMFITEYDKSIFIDGRVNGASILFNKQLTFL